MDSPSVYRQRRFLHRLRQRRMGVAGRRDVLGGGAELDPERHFADERARVGADDVHAEHPVGLGVGQNFHEALGGLVDLGASVGGERELPNLVGNTFRLQLVLAAADRGDLGIGVDHVRDRVVVHVASLARDDLGRGNTFVLGLVSEHRPRDHIADGEDARHAGAEMPVDLDAALLVKRDTRFLKAEAFGVRHAADGHEHHVGFHGLALAAAGGLDRHLERLTLGLHGGTLVAEADLDALLLLDALELARHVGVHTGQDAVEELDHLDLGAETAPHAAELKADHAGADHQQLLRHCAQREGAGRRHDALLVDLYSAQPRHVGTGGDHDIFGVQRLLLAAFASDLHLARARDAAGAVESVDLVLLEEEIDALDVALYPLVLEFLHARQIELRRRHTDAHGGELVASLLEQLGGIEQRLRRDAADVEAGAAEGPVLLHHRSLKAELCGADRAHVAAGTAADDDDVVGHERNLRLRPPWPGLSRPSTPSENSWMPGFGAGHDVEGNLEVDHEPRRILDDFLDPHQEGDRLAAVDDAVVVGQREVHHRPRHDLALARHRPLLDAMHAEDARLRRVEDRRRHQRAVDAAVRDGEGAALQLLDGELALARLLAELGDRLLDAGEREPVGVAHHRHYETLVAADGDADVVIILVDEVGAVDLGVDRGHVVQRLHHSLDEEAHEAQAHAVLLLEGVLVFRAEDRKS